MISLNFEYKHLKEHLSFLSNSCNKSGTDFTGHCVFEIHEGEIFISSFNNRTYSICRLVNKEFINIINLKFSIEYKRLDSFIKANKAELVVLEYHQDKQHTKVKLGSAVALLPTYKPSWLPSWSIRLPKTPPILRGIVTQDLKQALEFCKIAVSHSDTQPNLAVIGVKDGTVSSTDHKLAAIVTLPAKYSSLDFYVHAKNLTALQKFLTSSDECDIYQTQIGYIFSSEDKYFGEMQRALQPIYLSYANLSSAKHTFKIDRARLLQAYNSVWSSADWTDAKPLLIFGGDKAYVGAKTQFANTIYEEVAITSAHEKLLTPISLELSADFLKMIKTIIKKDIMDFYIVGTETASFLVVEDNLTEDLIAQNILITRSGVIKWDDLKN